MIRSAWKYYGVKIIFQMVITGEPIAERIDENYCDTHTFYEESIVLIRAQSFNHAYSIAERNALNGREAYRNVYGQIVETKMVEAIDCFLIYPDKGELISGTELYSSISAVEKTILPSEYFMQKYEYNLEDYDWNDTRWQRHRSLQYALRREKFSKWRRDSHEE